MEEAVHRLDMRSVIALFLVQFILVATLRADEKLPALKVGDGVFTNVTIWKVTATDVYFTHARGMGNAKLQDLEPALQKKFGYDPAKASEARQQQMQGNAQFRKEAEAARPPPARAAESQADAAGSGAGDDVVIRVPNVSAKQFLGKAAPRFTVEKWLTAVPETQGKFILVDFWATWCGPCRQSIPHLNGLYARFKDRVTFVGLSDETENEVRAMKSPVIDYAVAIDTVGRMKHEVQVKGIPHAMLIDPKGIVRFEGHPGYITEDGLERLVTRYAE